MDNPLEEDTHLPVGSAIRHLQKLNMRFPETL
ncbi:DUF1466 family protein [Nostoc sp. PCC 7524]|nr:DUF1466 family protein [Nostoc sp. PCC 7524]